MTLVEVLISIVILGLLGIGLVSLQNLLGQNQTLVFNNYVNVDEANKIINQFVKEMRIATTGENGAYIFEDLNDFDIEFYTDEDFDGVVEKVRYELNGTDFIKTVTQPIGYPVTYPVTAENARVLSHHVQNGALPIFYYFNSDWPFDTNSNPLAVSSRLQDTSTLKIYLRINTQEGESDKDFVIESYVQPRSLKNNL
jgi:hypothetical protein